MTNLVFTMVISGAVGLWWPVVITIMIGVLPEFAALIVAESWDEREKESTDGNQNDTVRRVARGAMKLGAEMILARNAQLRVEGLEHAPLRDRQSL